MRSEERNSVEVRKGEGEHNTCVERERDKPGFEKRRERERERRRG